MWCLAVLVCIIGCAAEGNALKYLHLPVRRVSDPETSLSGSGEHRKRASEDWFSETLANHRQYYSMEFSLGTPPQNLTLKLDTVAADVLIVDTSDSHCSKTDACDKAGVFDSSKSTTFDLGDSQVRGIYDSSHLNGSLSSDVLEFGGGKIENFIFASITESNLTHSVAGIGLSRAEILFDDIGIGHYRNLPEQLKDNGQISHVAYSLWLDAQSESSGTILFGAVDKAKFSGDLYRMPMVHDMLDEWVKRPAVKLQGLSVINSDGDEQRFALYNDDLALDSGSTLSYLPSNVLEPFFGAIGAVEVSEGLFAVDCDILTSSEAQLGIQVNGIDIRIPFNELGFWLASGKNGSNICIPGFLGSSVAAILGDNILRKLYVVYDLENYEIGLATAKTGTDDEDIEAIESSIPGKSAPEYSDTKISLFSTATVNPITILGNATPTPVGTEDISRTIPSSSFSVVLGGRVSGADNRFPIGNQTISSSRNIPKSSDIGDTSTLHKSGGKDDGKSVASSKIGVGSQTKTTEDSKATSATAVSRSTSGSRTKSGNKACAGSLPPWAAGVGGLSAFLALL